MKKVERPLSVDFFTGSIDEIIENLQDLKDLNFTEIYPTYDEDGITGFLARFTETEEQQLARLAKEKADREAKKELAAKRKIQKELNQLAQLKAKYESKD